MVRMMHRLETGPPQYTIRGAPLIWSMALPKVVQFTACIATHGIQPEMTIWGRGTLHIKKVHTFTMTSEGDIKVKIQSMRTKWKTWAGFGIQVRQGSTILFC